MSDWLNEKYDPDTNVDLSGSSVDVGTFSETASITSNDIAQLRQLSDDNGHHASFKPGVDDGPSCSYCGLDSPQMVAQCEGCSKWFCNSKTGNASSSHIVTHMTLSRHNRVKLHEKSDLGETSLECYNCGNQNVFSLGYISAMQEQVVVILCRLPCSQLKDENWDSDSWKPLIEDRQFLRWIVDLPTEDQLMATRPVDYQSIMRVENEWKSNKDASIDEVMNGSQVDDEQEEVLPILMRYADAFQYQRSFAPLVDLESEYDKLLKESQGLEHISVKWGLGLNNKHLASFGLSSYENSGLKVNVGDEVVLSYNGLLAGGVTGWQGKGYIIRLPDAHSELFTMEFVDKVDPPLSITTGFTVEFVWKGTSYQRMMSALERFATEETCCSSYLYHKILGHDVRPVEFDVDIPHSLSVPGFTPLNASQHNAVAAVLKRPLSLIQGPPGTGKTVTSATIIYQLQKLNEGQKILVCAPSNVAVDHVAAKLDQLKLKVVRVTARSREDVDTAVDHLTLHQKVKKGLKGPLRGLMKLKESAGELSAKDSRQYHKLLQEREQSLLRDADIICCTCIGAADTRLDGIKFRTVLIDESSQATEPEMLIPITKGARQVILVGDHQQLGPVVLDKRAAAAGLRQSLFERLIILGQVPIRLEVQYRMHPCLSEFASNMFYEGTLQDGVTAEDRAVKGSTFPWPIRNTPMMFWGNFGKEEISNSGLSYLNRVEAMNVEKIVTRLFKDGVKADQIGIVTPYEGQRAFILQYLSVNGGFAAMKDQYADIEVTSVDAFQGREKDFIILSCVRSNEQSIGFLRDPRRLNVALTRAKYGLVVLGNLRALTKSFLWNQLLIHYREKGCLVEGSLENLQLSMMQLTNKRGPAAAARFDTYNSVANGSAATAGGQTFSTASKEMWPRLGSSQDLNSSFYNHLSKLDADYTKTHAESTVTDDDIKSITSSFAAGFNLG